MNDEQMRPLLEVWLRDRDVPRPKVQSGVASVMADVPQTRQQGRWWPPSALDRPAPIPTTSGRTPARGFTMFSALKFVAAGVIVALFGGFLLLTITPMPQGDEVIPAAVTTSPSPVAQEDEVAATELPTGPAAFEALDQGMSLVASDPRFSGRFTISDETMLEVPTGRIIWSARQRVENDAGAWEGRSRAYGWGYGNKFVQQTWWVGEGAYEGLSAVTHKSSSSEDALDGLIFEGDVPFWEPCEPLPAAPTTASDEVVWHRLNQEGPEHERLACSDMGGTLSCDYDKVEEATLDFAWDAGTAQFSGEAVTASWQCPAWYPAPVCEGLVSAWTGTTRYQPVEGEAADVPQELVITDVDGQSQLWVRFVDWALACPWYGTFEEAMAANPDGGMDCAFEQ